MGRVAILLGVIFKIAIINNYWILAGHSQVRKRFLGGHFNKFHESSTKPY